MLRCVFALEWTGTVPRVFGRLPPADTVQPDMMNGINMVHYKEWVQNVFHQIKGGQSNMY